MLPALFYIIITCLYIDIFIIVLNPRNFDLHLLRAEPVLNQPKVDRDPTIMLLRYWTPVCHHEKDLSVSEIHLVSKVHLQVFVDSSHYTKAFKAATSVYRFSNTVTKIYMMIYVTDDHVVIL